MFCLFLATVLTGTAFQEGDATKCYRCLNLFGVLCRFQHCTGHITTGSWKGRGNQYIQFVRVLYCKLPTNGKQLPAFPLEAMPGIEPRPERWEARVLPLCHVAPTAVSSNYTNQILCTKLRICMNFPHFYHLKICHTV